MGKSGVARTTRSWGNIRAPNFGATPVGEEPGMSGSFPIWRDWLDGVRSTAARIVAPNHVYAGRGSIRSIFDWPANQNLVWAPAGDFNQPASYLRAMIDFMNAHTDREAGSQPVHLLISAGHMDSGGDEWNGEERKRTRPLAIAIADEAERIGLDVIRRLSEATGQRSRPAIQPAPDTRPRGDVPSRGQRLEIVTDARHDGHPDGARSGQAELNVRRIVIVLDEDEPPLTIRDVSAVAMDQI